MRRRSNRGEELEAELERRLKELEHREVAFKKITEAVMKNRPAAAAPAQPDPNVRAAEERAERAEQRARELQGSLADAARASEQLRSELETAQAAPPPAPELPPPAPEEPRGRFGRRRPDGRVQELEAEVESLRARIAELEQAPPEPPALLPPHEEAEAPEEAAPAFTGRPTLPQLEALAAHAAQAGRPQAEEWSVYVGLLREHAWNDGTIPPQFDDLLRDVFGATF